MDYSDIVIIGGGVVGLAVAAELAARFPRRTVTLLERNSRFGLETSSRNSEVIHAGLYYPAGSLKGSLCVEGNRLLYRFCRRLGIPHRCTGKLIVARSEAEIPVLETLAAQGAANGVRGLRLWGRRALSAGEPHIRAVAALYSPSTGIVDTHRLVTRLAEIAARSGAILGCRHIAAGLEPCGGGWRVDYLNPDGGAEAIRCAWLVNCAGLNADRVATWMGIDVNEAGYRLHYCKGEYFSLSSAAAALVSRPVYPPPLPELEGLGVHLTIALDGRARLGPNTCYTESIDYTVNPAHGADFYRAARTFLPFLRPEDLEPEMAGIRPKLQGPGDPFRDFIVRHEADRGLPGAINLVGIESPGLTCCLSLARAVAGLIS